MAQFGMWHRDGSPLTPGDDPADALAMLLPYGPDGTAVHAESAALFAFAPFHTTAESRREAQPVVIPGSLVLTFDGRLDNSHELVLELGGDAPPAGGDAAVAAAAYLRWGAACLAKFIGDWAVTIWDARTRHLLLARDFLGARPLYYRMTNRQVTWSSVIDPLATQGTPGLTLDEKYLLGWLTSLPPAHLTPYQEIAAVPPAGLVSITAREIRIATHWNFDPTLTVRYRRDADYEDHFRELFSRSVLRRLRSEHPVLADLSGGLDSSSIVCVADRLAADRIAVSRCVDTVSYYADDEPNWNERPYFETVEQLRGKRGLHIDVTRAETREEQCVAGTIPFLPGSMRPPASAELVEWVERTQCRVLLSGFGGDEVAGGVPTPIPELQDLLARARLLAFARKLHRWALQQKRPWAHLLRDALRDFLPRRGAGVGDDSIPGWLREEFVERIATRHADPHGRLRFFGPLPSLQANLETLDELQRLLACSPVSTSPLLEKRYPFLDRDLLVYLYAIPREQLVRPGQRRSLMRRALRGIVPDPVLDRRRKAFVSRLPIASINRWSQHLADQPTKTWLSRLGYIDDRKLTDCLDEVCRRQQAPTMTLLRAAGIEKWLAALSEFGTFSMASGRTRLELRGNSGGETQLDPRAEALNGCR